jgi:carbon-monoxide dehydrogenase large subunit
MTDAAASGATRYVGARINRIEDVRLLTGRGTYVDDIELPGMLHASFVRSPFARAAIRSIDTSLAIAVEGVRAIYTASDLNHFVKQQWHTSIGPDSPETPRPPLAEREARFVGDPVALVIAESRYLAEDAAELVDVDYDPMPAVVDYEKAHEAGALVHQSHGSNVIGEVSGAPLSSVQDLFAQAPHLVEKTIHQHAYAAAPMEGRGLIVDYAPTTGDLTIYSATQSPHEVRMFCARLLGMPEHRIRVIARDTGGWFGQKIMVQRDEMCIMLAGRRVGAPIKWIEDRRENLLSAGQSRHEHADVKMAFDSDGAIVAAQIDFVSDSGAYPTPWPVGTASVVGALFPGPYRVPAATFTARSMYTNTVGRSAYRGPWQFESLAREVLLDIAARRMGIDPVELRRRNLLRRDELPYANPNGMPYDSISPIETLEQAIEMLDYPAFRREQAAARNAGRYLGIGLSTYVEPSTPGFGYYATEAATIRIEPSGKVNVYIAGGSTGNSIETTVVQLTADALGANIEDVATIQGDTAVTGFGAGAAGSRSGSMTAGAVRETAGILRKRIQAIAAHKLEASPDDIDIAHSWASVRGTPSIGLSLGEIASVAYFDPYSLPSGVPAGLEASARYTAESRFIWVNATHVCTCEVDIATGGVKLP